MKYTLLAIASCTCLLLTSCFKDEPLNAECDIERVSLHVDNAEDFFFQLTDSVRDVLSTDTVITFNVRSHADLTALAPVLTITPGATVVPASGSVQNFADGPVTYVVTSEDGNWSRRYRIAFNHVSTTVSDTLYYDMEDFMLESSHESYYVWYNVLADGTISNDWASGNGGYKLSKSSAEPDEYPTYPIEGMDGYGVRLITRDTGAFGRMANKPIAAGNLYIGEFDITVALRTPLMATRFGKPFAQKPVSFMGYYRYWAGDVYKDRDGNVVDLTDVGSIYAVLYRNHDAQGNEVMLHGDDVQTNENIVAIAKVTDVHNTSEWTAWNVTFDYTEDIDTELLANMGYNLTIVFSSSVMGDQFEGAIGSTLDIDCVRLVCTHEE